MRHDASEIAWHARQLSRYVSKAERLPVASLTGKCIVRARISLIGEGLQVLVYAEDQTDLFAPNSFKLNVYKFINNYKL